MNAIRIADVDHAHGIVERVIVDHEPRVSSSFEDTHEIAELDVLLHGDDIGARDHDIADAAFAQAKNILEHPAFFRREAGFTGTHDIKYVLEVSARRPDFQPNNVRSARTNQPRLLLGRRDRHRQIARLEWSPGRTG